MMLNELISIKDPIDRLTAANGMKRDLEEAYYTCAQKEDTFFDETKETIEEVLSPILNEAKNKLEEITEQTEGNIGKVKDVASGTGKAIKEKVEQMQDDFLEQMQNIYVPLVDLNTEVKVPRIQMDMPEDQTGESVRSEEHSNMIRAWMMSFISQQRAMAQLQSQRENSTQDPQTLAAIKQETLMAMEDLYLNTSSSLRQYTMKISTTYGEVALNTLSTKRDEINEISQRKNKGDVFA